MIYNREMETLSKDEREDLQLQRLQTRVKKVYDNVAFYKEKFDELGVAPEDISSLDDIVKLPFTTKQDLRNHYPFGLFAVPMEEVERIHASSGTSGKPTVVGYTKTDINNWAELVARSIVAAGGRKSDIFHIAYGYGLFTGGLGLHYGAEQLGTTIVPVSGGNTERQITLIEDFKPRGICGTPSYILNLAEKMEEMGKDPKATSLEYGILGAEPWSEEMRVIIEKKLQMKAVDIYGLSEVMGPGIAIECHEAQDGLHVQEDHFILEVINPETLQPVPEGEDGELVFTTLTKEAFPLIRYRTGDVASITRETCICGRTTARMSRVKGRTDDMLIIHGVNVFPSEIERVLFQIDGLVPYYQLHLVKKGSMDHVELHVEIDNDVYHRVSGDLSDSTILQLKEHIYHSVKSSCLVSMDIVINKPKAIPRTDGKAIRIVDQRKSNVTI